MAMMWRRRRLGLILWFLIQLLPRAISETKLLSGQLICAGGESGACYKFAFFQEASRRVGHEEAAAACSLQGAALLSVESPSEQRLVESLLGSLAASSGLADGDFWLGLRRDPSRGVAAAAGVAAAGGAAGGGDAAAGGVAGGGHHATRRPPAAGGLGPEAAVGAAGGPQGGGGGPAACAELYAWSDGSGSTFRNWYPDEPSCGGEACVVMYFQPSAPAGYGGPYMHRWNDDSCTMKNNFICKFPPLVGVGEEEAPGSRRNASDGAEHVLLTETSGESLHAVYVAIPAIPLLLLLVVALGLLCSRSCGSPPAHDGNQNQVKAQDLWIPAARFRTQEV
ncbi:chondrolectin-like [Petromyzon marinus]|uniref:chondrolectin-like n=1 Tax=Petromyzon marinus TaxID=7757 RepID=UPI003F6F3493